MNSARTAARLCRDCAAIAARLRRHCATAAAPLRRFVARRYGIRGTLALHRHAFKGSTATNILFDGTTALVADPGDAEGLGDRLATLLHDDDRRQRLAATGRDLVAGFSWDQAAADLEAVLEAYLARPGAFRRPPGPEPGGGSENPFSLR